MKQAIFVFVITAIILSSCFFWITQGVELDPIDKLLACSLGLTLTVSASAITYVFKINN